MYRIVVETILNHAFETFYSVKLYFNNGSKNLEIISWVHGYQLKAYQTSKYIVW